MKTPSFLTSIRLDLWDVRRLLQLFEEVPQEIEDKDLWLKLRAADERISKRLDRWGERSEPDA